MTKPELIKEISAKAGISQRQAAAALDAFTGAVTKTLSKGGSVRLVGFGTFEVRRRAARKGVVPGTKKQIKIPARNVPFFKPGAGLKKVVK
ncbi:MAG: HU family DNA-binding protein [bacterium JZ-2024 1]